jgi:TonB family protein
MKGRIYLVVALSLAVSACASVADKSARAKDLYRHGDYAAAFLQFQTLAAQGDLDAEGRLGYMYWYGQGTTVDYTESIRWYTAAATAGDAYAQYGLGGVYASGTVVPRDLEKADAWYKQAALQGYADAEAQVGVDYLVGRGIQVNYDAAQLWLQKAVDAGDDGTAEAGLGTIYLGGLGVAKSYPTGKDWFEQAAQKQFRPALFYLANCYHYGAFGFPKDESQSLKYYEMAADVPVHSLMEFETVMKAIIDQHKTYPAEAVTNHESGDAEVTFDCVDQKPLNIRIAQSSGHNSLDKAAMLTVFNSIFPKKPSSLSGVNHIRIVVNFALGAPAAAPAASSH